MYACETYYNLTETQIRQLERIEELNSDEKYKNIQFEEIFKDNINKQLEISRIFFKNLQSREKQLIVENISHVIQRDPLFSVVE